MDNNICLGSSNDGHPMIDTNKCLGSAIDGQQT